MPFIMIVFCFIILFSSWLIPNHYSPWSSAWNDAAAITGLLSISICSFFKYKKNIVAPKIFFIFFIVSIASIATQYSANHIAFLGDAVVAILYLSYWLIAILISKNISEFFDISLCSFTSKLNIACTLSAIFSTGIAISQWTGALNLGIYGAELPPNGRPFGNVAQPNHLCTLCFLGICALFWLHEKQQIGKSGFWVGVLFLLSGMLLSQSRTGWLQIVLLMVWGSIQSLRMSNRIPPTSLALLGGIFGAGVFLWQPLNDLLLLSPGRDLSNQMHPGSRLAYWLSMLDALWREPWWGYGWQQVGAAQQNVAIDHPPLTEYFEHSHNLVLDLMLWNGIPLGLVLTALLGFWLYQQIRSYAHPHTGWLLAALMGLGIHGLLEFPLEYAYFLIPAGLLMGGIEASNPQASGRWITIPHKVFAGSIVAIAAISIMVAGEWLTAEANYRSLRFESASIGEPDTTTEAPNLRLLTQLSAFLAFARTEATPEMSAEQVEWMRQVATRFGYPPVMFRYALAAGFHGHAHQAEITLQRICHIHGPKRCAEAQEGWLLLQQQYPQLQKIPGP
ncbi:PglL family O-oligosaccharyltransferase [Comamonas aquatica]|uniref:PglL family O-oligosaccharyltransferase n=1 Tax=Comamonas aquatica TaxID=225991 RepID=UPI00244801B8|nr:O-antigen ligase family protein [Comamonas aquatica]MDH1812778.1 Wzy polymerase domain-containing protein [Comamonas aquatica]